MGVSLRLHMPTDPTRNHALYALFPLISTEVLTPFMDLLEDALIEQVPPIVVSRGPAKRADPRHPSD